MRLAAAAAFESWIAALAADLVAQGAAPDRSEAAGGRAACLVEGALLVSRTTRSTTPVRIVGPQAAAIVAEALAPTAIATARGRATTSGPV